VSAFSHTDWTVMCNGVAEDGASCGMSERTDTIGGDTATEVRHRLKRRGWTVNVPSQDDSRVRRLDYCPDHKPVTDQPSAPMAGKESR
jgi:hypothetical protein